MRRSVSEVMKEVESLENNGVPMTYRQKQQIAYNEDVIKGKLSVEEAYVQNVGKRTVPVFKTIPEQNNALVKMRQGGSLPKMQEAGFLEPTPEVQIDPTRPSAEEYRRNIQQNYNKVLQTNSKTPYIPGVTEGSMNCINGVCSMIKRTNGKQFTRDTYTGNATFNDNLEKEGYYTVDPTKEAFEIGDVVQYSRKKGRAERFGGKTTPLTENELYPQHAKLITDKFVDQDGETQYVIVHNSGEENMFKKTISEAELLSHTKGYLSGIHKFDGLLVQRYDPEVVTQRKKEKEEGQKVLQGQNEFAKEYSVPVTGIDFTKRMQTLEGEEYDKRVNTELAKIYTENYSKLANMSNMPKKTFDQMLALQAGIQHMESGKGGIRAIAKEGVPDLLLDEVRRMMSDSDEGSWVDVYWKDNAENVQDKFKTKQEFKEYLNRDNKLSAAAAEWAFYNSPRSKGAFQQKELSERGRFLSLDSNLESYTDQALASITLMMDNYHRAKKKYPDATEEELLDLSVLMHNAPSKAMTPEFYRYFVKNKDVDYVNEVKQYVPSIKIKQLETRQISEDEKQKLSDFINSLSDAGPQMRYGGSLPDLPKYQVGTPASYIDQHGNPIEVQTSGSYQMTAYDKTGFFSAEEKQLMSQDKPNQRYVPQGSPQDEAALSKLADPFKPEGSWKAQSTYNLHASGAMDHVAQGGRIDQFENPEYHINSQKEKPLPKYQNGTKTKIIADTDSETGETYTAFAPLHSLPEATVTDKLDRTNPVAVRNWSRTNDPIAYNARKASGDFANNYLYPIAEVAPGTGDVSDVMHLGKAIQDRDFTNLGVAAAAATLPYVTYGALKGGKALFQEAIYRGIEPLDYKLKDKVRDFIPNLIKNSRRTPDERALELGYNMHKGISVNGRIDTARPMSKEAIVNDIKSEGAFQFGSDGILYPTDQEVFERLNAAHRKGADMLDAFNMGIRRRQTWNTFDQIEDNTFRINNHRVNIPRKGTGRELETPFFEDMSKYFDRYQGHLKNLEQYNENLKEFGIEGLKEYGLVKPEFSLKTPIGHFEPGKNRFHVDGSGRAGDLIRGGYTVDIKPSTGPTDPIVFTSKDTWDLNPIKKGPLKNLEFLRLVGGKPYNIKNTYEIDPTTFKTLRSYQNGGALPKYQVGTPTRLDTLKTYASYLAVKNEIENSPYRYRYMNSEENKRAAEVSVNNIINTALPVQEFHPGIEPAGSINYLSEKKEFLAGHPDFKLADHLKNTFKGRVAEYSPSGMNDAVTLRDYSNIAPTPTISESEFLTPEQLQYKLNSLNKKPNKTNPVPTKKKAPKENSDHSTETMRQMVVDLEGNRYPRTTEVPVSNLNIRKQ
jgi:hypothetical protein